MRAIKKISLKQIAFVVAILVALIGVAVLVSVLGEQKEEPQQAPIVDQEILKVQHKIIGTSVQGRSIESYTYGDGNIHLAFVGGIHGGYEWNSVLLAYEFMDYVNEHPKVIPDNVTVTVIPSANPDGVYKIIGKEGRFTLADAADKGDTSSGRFNARGVDLNRNFDCKWQPESTWRGNTVSAGTAPFQSRKPRLSAILF
jgi:murein tripeptide amidase MpaA